ncbi:MAG: hypothetical protein IKR48_11360 [Kiritimatiellae bacterium]|nr:hypothetical protein [Kiritimatiellia bacterium]
MEDELVEWMDAKSFFGGSESEQSSPWNHKANYRIVEKILLKLIMDAHRVGKDEAKEILAKKGLLAAFKAGMKSSSRVKRGRRNFPF